MIQRTQALLEQRQRIRNAARRMFWVNTSKNDFNFSIHVELHPSDFEHVDEMQTWIENLVSNDMTFDYNDCNIVSDQLYEVISEHYPGRNIKITVSTKNIGITIFYKTHRPIQKLAI